MVGGDGSGVEDGWGLCSGGNGGLMRVGIGFWAGVRLFVVAVFGITTIEWLDQMRLFLSRYVYELRIVGMPGNKVMITLQMTRWEETLAIREETRITRNSAGNRFNSGFTFGVLFSPLEKARGIHIFNIPRVRPMISILTLSFPSQSAVIPVL